MAYANLYTHLTPSNEQPSFYAYRNGGNYTTSNTSFEKLNVDATRWNTGGHFNTQYSRFTAPVAGVYSFSASVNRYNISADYLLAIGLWVNNSVYAFGSRFHSRGTTDLNASMSSTVKLDANDYVEVWSYSNDSSTGFSNGAVWNYFSGHLVGK